MGCAASTTASAPAQQPPSGQQMAIEVQQQQPNARPVAMNQLQRPSGVPAPSANRGGNLQNAPIIRSIVDLKRENIAIDNAADGCFVRVTFTSLTAGEAIVYFNVREASSDDKAMTELEAAQVSRHSFSAGSAQVARIFLCKDLEGGLASFTEAKDKHHVVIELKADSSDTKAITMQRSCLKLNSDNTGAQVTAQKVRCGTAVRTLQALYGTMPNPKASAEGSTTTNGDESGECVICLSKPREVTILHCRHVCLCRSCATITSSTWSFQCPVCRGRVAAMIGVEGG